MEQYVTLRLYYDETATREDEDEIREELANDIQMLDDVVSVDVQQVFVGVPYEAIITLEYSNNTDSGVRQTVVTEFDYLHNVDITDNPFK